MNIDFNDLHTSLFRFSANMVGQQSMAIQENSSRSSSLATSGQNEIDQDEEAMNSVLDFYESILSRDSA